MWPQGFFLGISDGVTRAYVNKSEALTPRHYKTIQFTWKLSRDGYVYIKTKKVMYVLKQVSILAYNNLVKNLAPCGYVPYK